MEPRATRTSPKGACPASSPDRVSPRRPACRLHSVERIVVEPRDQGYGRQAIRLLKRYAFEELGAHRLWLSVKEFNARGRALYVSEGFVEEGMLRECVKGPAAYESALMMAILDREYTLE